MKFLVLLKKNLLWIFAAIGAIVAFVLGRGRVSGSSKVISVIDDARKEEVERIEAARKLERDEMLENQRKHDVAVTDANSKHIAQKTQLDVEMSAQRTKLAEKNVDELADVVGKQTGYKVIKPSE